MEQIIVESSQVHDYSMSDGTSDMEIDRNEISINFRQIHSAYNIQNENVTFPEIKHLILRCKFVACTMECPEIYKNESSMDVNHTDIVNTSMDVSFNICHFKLQSAF